ncbi:MAG: VPLPA-CTERM sorting domain-containing protein [Pseudomonadota bacterium]
MTKHYLTVLLLSLCLAVPTTAGAATFRYVINDGAFNDGGIFSGFFEYESGTDSITTYELSVSGGNTGTFSAFTYSGTQANRGGRFIGLSPQVQLWTFGELLGPRNLTLGFRDGIFSGNELAKGETFSLITGNVADETVFPDFISREVVGGTVIATSVPVVISPAVIPLPATAWLMVISLGGLAALRRRARITLHTVTT